MKLVIICAVLTLALIEASSAQSHNISWGNYNPNDRMLYREIIRKKSQFLQIVTEDVQFQSAARITYIKCTDQYVNGNGGYATLLKGGVGYNDVILHLKSQRGHGFNFIVEIYGTNN